ncbi:MAG: hypothetical protein KDA36_03575, partial [Planctomycetaceae bacterium]|nr:hypothetical protein [Planctomycetaceae bacterium]
MTGLFHFCPTASPVRTRANLASEWYIYTIHPNHIHSPKHLNSQRFSHAYLRQSRPRFRDRKRPGS